MILKHLFKKKAQIVTLSFSLLSLFVSNEMCAQNGMTIMV
jgi:hypothetical protein